MSDSQLFPQPSSQEPRAPEPRRRAGRGGAAAIAVSLVVIAVSSLIGRGCGSAVSRLFTGDRTRPTVTFAPTPAPEWRTHTPEGVRMTVELPGEPREVPIAVPPEMRRAIVALKTYGMERDGLTVMLAYVEYAPSNVTVVDAEDRAVAALEGMRSSGAPDLQYEIDNPRPGESTFTGSVTRNGIPAEVNGFVRARGLRVWNVITIHRSSSTRDRADAERVRRSVVLQ